MASVNPSDPAFDAKAVTPSDETILAAGVRGLYIGGAGNVAVVTEGGTSVTFNGAAAGTVIPIRVIKVMSTGTTATNILTLH